jgi:CheY-like chemotaxis protein
MDNIQQLTYNHSNFERKKKTIMICDDEPDMLLSFELMLKPSYDVTMTTMGIKIDLILIDYRMGDTLGDSVARKLREHNGTNMIPISAYELDANLIKELEKL